MPTTGVVDAFKNLIRHGKHFRAQDDTNYHNPYAQPHAAQQVPQQQQQQSPPVDQNRQQREAQQQQSATQKKHGTPKYKEHVEQIVQEEREAKGKMSVYQGLENYKLIEKMGDGAFSNVYKAIDIRSGQKVAVKVVRKYELSASQAGEKHLNREFKKKPRVTERANILKEVQIMRGINHPAVVKLLAFFESPEHYYLILELMEGGELFHQIVKLTYFSENLARHVIVQVAQGIRYLHEERGVVHRDIKPENLLFDRIPVIPPKNPLPKQSEEDKEDEGEFIPGVGGGGIGTVKIADFGLSKVVWDEQTMTPCGTVGYTAPEIVKDERYSKSVDMWALGCVLYTLLCGFPPFYDESINVLTEKVARGYYTFLSPWWDPISASAKELISHLLCVDPAQRFTIDEFLAHPWILGVPTAPAHPTPLPSVTRALDSPLLAGVRGGAREARSPGIATLKEAFDITYAVHRMEEEGAHRRAQKGGANRGFLQNLNESDEEDKEKATPKQPSVGAGAKIAARRAVQGDAYDGRAGQRDRGRRTGGGAFKPFELDMDGATLLGRRHKRAVDGSPGMGTFGGSPLTRMMNEEKDDEPLEAPMSPMRVD